MFIRAGTRFNIYAGDTIDGVRYANFTDPTVQQLLGITEIADPEPPVDYNEFDYYRTEQDEAPYVIYTRKTDVQVADIRWEKIKQIRDEYIAGMAGCKVEVAPGDFRWFHTDTYSKIQQLGLESAAILLIIQGSPLTTPLSATPWKTMDGTTVIMTAQLALTVAMAQKVRDGAIFGIAEMKRLDTSPLNEGWPERYVPPVVEQEPEVPEEPVDPEVPEEPPAP